MTIALIAIGVTIMVYACAKEKPIRVNNWQAWKYREKDGELH